MKLMITYDKLWDLLKARGISQYSLIKNYQISRSQLNRIHLDTPTAKARGILEKSDCLCNPYSQRACQQPPTQFLIAEVLLTFLCDVARSVDVRIDERVFFGAIQPTLDTLAGESTGIRMLCVVHRNLIAV